MWPLLQLWIGSKEALRVVCVIVVVGWVLGVAMFVLIAIAAANRAEAVVDLLFSWQGLAAIALVGGAVAVANLLLFFPRCARCSKLLFEGRRPDQGWDGKADIRHHRAKTFMNSYRKGAIVELAMTGNMSCSHCGHKLGTKPDYVVTPPE